MRRVIISIFAILLVAACSPQEDKTTSTPSGEAKMVAPQPIAPDDGYFFVDSDLEVTWDWPQLDDDERYVVRLWIDDDAPQEVWLEANTLNIAGMIDSFSRAVGTYEWQVAVVKTDASGGFESMGSEWSTPQKLERVRRLPLEPKPYDQLSDVARLVADQNFASATETIDFVRSWMYQNITIGDDLFIYEPDYSDAVQAMYIHAQGEGEAPTMYCNGITVSMITVLAELGIESRAVLLYGEAPGWVAQHTIIEVFNPDTQRWEVHNPIDDIYYITAETGHRVDMPRLVFGSLDTIEGCFEGHCDVATTEESIEVYLGAYRYGNGNEIFVNLDRLDLTRRVEVFDNTNFPEFIASVSSIPVTDLIFRFDA